MGFFSPSVICNICEQKVGLNRFKDEGIITSEEFNAKKKQLLGI
ncbi:MULTISPECIES: SHOCT domain-containing protein [unclassified Clostridium]|nr:MULTISPECIES: SHOCT domain-containing protein [unclassified Clostridium]NFR85593.1 SHOCT domain-containing protein [Clostridium botulinum]NFR88810.1 SHOCT domain-containing protein [Clostridium botulinum]NFT98296.1 SHOCT domain-containing protein [Clostridium botulinum]